MADTTNVSMTPCAGVLAVPANASIVPLTNGALANAVPSTTTIHICMVKASSPHTPLLHAIATCSGLALVAAIEAKNTTTVRMSTKMNASGRKRRMKRTHA